MKSDTIKLIASIGVATITAIGGSLLLVYIAMQPVIEGKEGLMALISGFVGASYTYLFTSNTATAAVRNYQSGQRQGL